MIGTRIGHYRILDRLGSGGMGVVWLAQDENLGRRVALKMLRDDLANSPEKRARFEREARSVAALNHPNIVTLYAVGEDKSHRFITMEYVEGTTLDEAIPLGGLSPTEVLRIGADIADALGEAHAHGIVHRDLKPGNVLVAKDGRVKVVDFGLARALDGELELFDSHTGQTSLTQDGLAVGTLHYMSPEQLQLRKIDHRSDLFSLGVVLFEMATGELPFPGESAAVVISAMLRDHPRRIDERSGKLPPQIADLVDRLLSKEPADRPGSALEVRDALDGALRLLQSETAALPGSRTTGVTRRRRPHAPARRRGWTIAAAGGVLAALVGGWALVHSRATTHAAPLAAAVPQLPALAVLPLSNYSSEPEWVVDGMTDSIIGALARVDTLRVISRQSAMHYKNSNERLPEIAKELGVNYVLEGSLRRDGEELRVQAQLFRPDPEQQIWSGSFTRASKDVLALHADVARAVATALHIGLSASTNQTLGATRPVDPEAYDLYLQGRRLLEQERPEPIRQARALFEKALVIDPSFAPAHAGLAGAYGGLAYLFEDPGTNARREEQEARRAIQLDPKLSYPHALLAESLRYFHWDWAASEAAYKRALALDPNFSIAHRGYWGLLASQGRLDEARQQLEEALKLDPLSASCYADLGFQHLFEGSLVEAEQSFKEALSFDENLPFAQGGLWVLYDMENRDAERSRALRGWLVGNSESDLLALYDSLPTHMDYPAKARALGLRAEELSRTKRVSIGLGAALLASAGELDRAAAWLERAYRERDPELVWLAEDPSWRALYDRADFKTLLREMNLPSPGSGGRQHRGK